jgi:pSer/pThr/pTyr-binding forkhead associated (FHA) protein
MAAHDSVFTLIYREDGAVQRHVLAAGSTVAGRAPACDLVIKDASISRRHASFLVNQRAVRGDRCRRPQRHISQR